MKRKIRVSLYLFTVFLLLLAPLAGLAQETTSAIRVALTGADGNPASGVAVTVTDTRTGTSRVLTTGDGGSVTASGLRVGGPFTVQVSSAAHGDMTVSDIFTRLGDT